MLINEKMIKITDYEVEVTIKNYPTKKIFRQSIRNGIHYNGDIKVNIAINNVIMFSNNIESDVSILINL